MNYETKVRFLFEKVKHKDNQLSQRLNVFLTGTSLLLVAFFVSYDVEMIETFRSIRVMICLLGISFSIGIMITIFTGYWFTETLVNDLIWMREKKEELVEEEGKKIEVFDLGGKKRAKWWRKGHLLAGLIPLGPIFLWVLCLFSVLK
mgnify:CR=1 FL=1